MSHVPVIPIPSWLRGAVPFALIGLTVLAIAPFAQTPIGGDSAVPIFIVAATAVLLTAALLFQRFLVERSLSLLTLGATYLVVGFAFIAYLLVIPGVFDEDRSVLAVPAMPMGSPAGMGMEPASEMKGMGPSGAPQKGDPARALEMSPAGAGKGDMPMPGEIPGMIVQMWLWILAHVLFAIGVVAALAIGRWRPPLVRLRRGKLVVGCVVLGCGALVALVTSGLVQYWPRLPQIMHEGPPALPVALLALPIASWLGRRNGTVERWALVALYVSAADVLLTTISERPFTLGWYGGRLLNVMAAAVLLVAMIAEISRLYRRLAAAHSRLTIQASHDQLTGTLTRSAVLDQAEELLARVRAGEIPATMALLDIDHFKQVNDFHGHLVGDRALTELAGRMLVAVREGDHVGRYGGEEFIILLPGLSGREGRAVADRVRELVRAEPARTQAGDLPVTVSLGVTELRPDDESLEAALARADAALYEAKALGRDRVSFDQDRSPDGVTLSRDVEPPRPDAHAPGWTAEATPR